MSIENAKRLAALNQSARGCGKTWTLIQGMKANLNAVCIVGNKAHGDQLAKEHSIDRRRFITVEQLSQLYGTQKPAVVDLQALSVFNELFYELAEQKLAIEGAREILPNFKHMNSAKEWNKKYGK